MATLERVTMHHVGYNMYSDVWDTLSIENGYVCGLQARRKFQQQIALHVQSLTYLSW